MSTSYYLPKYKMFEDDIRHKENYVHIGNSSSGWEFLFRAYTNKEFRKIISWKHWKKLIFKIGYVIDEYNRTISVFDFIKIVENSKKSYRNSVTYDIIIPTNFKKYCEKHEPNHLKYLIVDSEGFTLDKTEFS